jgi:death-on-curing protein
MDQGDGPQVVWLDQLVDQVRLIHEKVLFIGGGARGEHTASLCSSCARPFQTAFGEPLYRVPYERAAALFHSIICNHPFVDGNKRTGTIAALLLLDAEGTLPEVSSHGYLRLDLLGQVALATASGHLDAKQVEFWMRRIFESSE